MSVFGKYCGRALRREKPCLEARGQTSFFAESLSSYIQCTEHREERRSSQQSRLMVARGRRKTVTTSMVAGVGSLSVHNSDKY